MSRVALVGSTGMLGSTMTRVLEGKFENFIEFNRSGQSVTGNNRTIKLNLLDHYDLHESFKGLDVEYVFNATGLIKQKINENDRADLEAADLINNLFVKKLNTFSVETGIKVIQIGTDCVYSGETGNYSEVEPMNPSDTYSTTKYFGEIASPDAMTLRCSIVGKERVNSISLMSWLLSQPPRSKLNGFTNHFWNGLTTLHFSEIVAGIIKSEKFENGVMHLVPKDVVSKYELLKIIALEFGREDLEIQEFATELKVDRSLCTSNPEKNLQLWNAGGYDRLPTIQEMVSDYSNWVEGNQE